MRRSVTLPAVELRLEAVHALGQFEDDLRARRRSSPRTRGSGRRPRACRARCGRGARRGRWRGRGRGRRCSRGSCRSDAAAGSPSVPESVAGESSARSAAVGLPRHRRGGGSGSSRARRSSWRKARGLRLVVAVPGRPRRLPPAGLGYHRGGTLAGQFLRLLVVVPDDPHVGEDLLLALADDLEPAVGAVGNPAVARQLEQLLGERVRVVDVRVHVLRPPQVERVVRPRVEGLAVSSSASAG